VNRETARGSLPPDSASHRMGMRHDSGQALDLPPNAICSATDRVSAEFKTSPLPFASASEAVRNYGQATHELRTSTKNA